MTGRTRDVSGAPLPTLGRPHGGVNNRHVVLDRIPKAGTSRDRFRIWGKTPQPAFDQSSMAGLFEMQKRLKVALRRQARLTKSDVDAVLSTETERLRMVNEAMLHASSYSEGVENIFSVRKATASQLLAEEVIRRQGLKVIGSAKHNRKGPGPASTSAPRRHRSLKQRSGKIATSMPALEDCFSLQGPLLREFSRARKRGYAGTPSSWMRSTKGVQHWKLIFDRGLWPWSPSDRVDCFNRHCPLHWVVTGHSGIRVHNLCHGFQGERLRTQPTNFVVLRRQAGSVKRLKHSDWPIIDGRRCWPNFPTLNESWEMILRRKSPTGHKVEPDPRFLRSDKIPTLQVKPGVAVRVVSRIVLGIRADVEVPRKFLAYFSYRWGFLILHRRRALPNPLVKWIAQLWKRDVTSMLLVHPIRYNDALRRIPSNALWALNGFFRGGIQQAAAPKSRSRTRLPREGRRAA